MIATPNTDAATTNITAPKNVTRHCIKDINLTDKTKRVKIKKEFKFETPLFYKDKVLAQATISGKGYYDWQDVGFYDYCYADVIDVVVRLNLNGYEQDVTFAYIVDKGLLGDFSDLIDKAIHAHLEYIFSPEYAVTATATHDGTATIVEPVTLKKSA